MTYLQAFAVVALSALLAGSAAWIVGRFMPVEIRRRRHEVGAQVFCQVGLMISVLLAFVFSEVWSQYRTEALAINGECAALHGAAMLADALPHGKGRPVNEAIVTYASDVIAIEWPAMARRHRSPQAAEDMDMIVRAAARLRVARPAEVTMQSQMLSLLSQAHANREMRTFQIHQGTPPLVWVMVTSISLVLVGFVIFSGVDAPTHIILTALFAASMALVLVLVRMLDYPFEGAMALSDADFVKMLSQVSSLLGAARS
jgi:Protein of unknown function (DUF4239)